MPTISTTVTITRTESAPTIEQLDAICRCKTGFKNFGALISAGGVYTPTIDMTVPAMRTLADAYDTVMAALGDPRRAYRTGR